MPYGVFRDGDKHCVHKLDADGEKAERVPGGCHDTEKEAQDHATALRIHADEKGMEDGRRLMLIITSNAYKDREGEIVSQKALEEYVAAHWIDPDTGVDDGGFENGSPLLLWHGGDAIGDIIYADTEGPFLIEIAAERPDGQVNLAAEDEPPLESTVRAVWDALEGEPDLGASHEFFYLRPDEEDGVFERILKWETSVLPRSYAANRYTLGVILNEGESNG